MNHDDNRAESPDFIRQPYLQFFFLPPHAVRSREKKMEFKPPLIIKTSLDISSFFWYVTWGTVLDDSVVFGSIFSLLRLSWRASNPAEKRPNTRLIAGMTVRERLFGLMAFSLVFDGVFARVWFREGVFLQSQCYTKALVLTFWRTVPT